MFSRLSLPFLCAGLAGLPLTAPAIAAPNAADTPVVTVQQFLVARGSGDTGAAYNMLSFESQQMLPAKQFADGTSLPPGTPAEMSGPVYALAVLFSDTHNAAHWTFRVLGVDPADPHRVQVRATPPASAKGVSASTVRVVTVNAPTGAARLNLLGSMELADPTMFAKARERAKRAASQSNLKQLSLGIIQYEQDHDELMPDAAKWVDEIMPYVKDKAIFHDPSAPASQAYSYAYNRTLSHQGLALMEAPASTVVLFESTKGVKNASDTGQSVPRPGRYLGGTDYAFADGHVKWFPDGTKLSYKLTGK